MKKFVLGLGLIGLLLLTGCGTSIGGGGSSGTSSGGGGGSGGGGSGGGGGTTSEYPLSPSGNYKLLPGYKYDCEKSEVYEMFVREHGNVMFSPAPLSFNVFDKDYNVYYSWVYGGSSYAFNAGHYYITPYECAERNHEQTFSVQSNVLE